MKLLLTTVDLNFNLECFLVILLLMKPFFRTLQSICGFPFSVGHILIIMDSLYNSHFHSYIYDFFILEKSLAFMNIQKKQFHQIWLLLLYVSSFFNSRTIYFKTVPFSYPCMIWSINDMIRWVELESWYLKYTWLNASIRSKSKWFSIIVFTTSSSV